MAVNNVNNNPYAFLNGTSSTTSSSSSSSSATSGQLSMSDFLSLMTTQLKNQDPMKPMDSGAFLGQIASFGTVSGISDLQTSFDSFAKSMQSNQALQGSSLVGHSVVVPSSIGLLDSSNGLQGKIKVTDPVTDLKVNIYSESGELVKTLNLGSASGDTAFSWDGVSDNGATMPAGTYQFKASGTVNGTNTAFATSTVANVNSVQVGSGASGLTVNLAGIGAVPFSEVEQII